MKKFLVLLLILMLVAVPALAEEVPRNNIDLTPIIQAIIGLCAMLISYKLVPWLTARTSASQQETIRLFTKTLVYAAEQLYKTGMINNRLEYVKMKLVDKGYGIDLVAIEAAVREINIAQAKPPDQVPQ